MASMEINQIWDRGDITSEGRQERGHGGHLGWCVVGREVSLLSYMRRYVSACWGSIPSVDSPDGYVTLGQGPLIIVWLRAQARCSWNLISIISVEPIWTENIQSLIVASNRLSAPV